MALEALQHYSEIGNSATAKRASTLYLALKKNVVGNLVEQFERTGLFYEHYNDRTGQGSGQRPFTGWTALVFSILTDDYS